MIVFTIFFLRCLLIKLFNSIEPCASTEGIAFPSVTSLAHCPATSSASYLATLNYKRALPCPYQLLRHQPQKFPQTPGASLISVQLRGTFPLGLPECIRQTSFTCVRGANRACCCWLAILFAGLLQISFATAPTSKSLLEFIPYQRFRQRSALDHKSELC